MQHNSELGALHVVLIVVCVTLLIVHAEHQTAAAEPIIHDDGLTLEVYATGFCCHLTGMEFMPNDSLLVLQKNGDVRLVKDRHLVADVVLTVDTISFREMGLLGITRSDEAVYFYYTVPDEGGNPVYNRIERYIWDGQSLIDPVAMLEMPANLYHNGGAMVTGPDGQVYAVIGDTGRYGPLQNKGPESYHISDMADYLDTSVVLRVDPPGDYHAIGIRNSFGLAFDPVTGIMWDTENGDDDSDEINIVHEGFNSGWEVVMGMATEGDLLRIPTHENYQYEDPKFTWYHTVAPTGIGFVNFTETDKYNNSVFVGDCNHGRLYMFTMNQNRDGFVFSTPDLQDAVADDGDSLEEVIVAEGLGCITHIRTGPDGYLYVASYSHDTIYRVLPTSAIPDQKMDTEPPQERQAQGGGGCLIATAAYGTELASQVQTLREIRDNTILSTESGAAFISTLNTFYYSFSPTVADLERESPTLRTMIRGAITPMIYSLSFLDVVDDGSELQVILFGTLIILFNIAIYVAIPVLIAAYIVNIQLTKHTGDKPHWYRCKFELRVKCGLNRDN